MRGAATDTFTVHPRVCGETPSEAKIKIDEGGSIPACAGKPRSCGRPASIQRVHPRVCGETPELRPAGVHPEGPSPRVRGNLFLHRLDVLRVGSIPACAGKPYH